MLNVEEWLLVMDANECFVGFIELSNDTRIMDLNTVVDRPYNIMSSHSTDNQLKVLVTCFAFAIQHVPDPGPLAVS